MTQQRPRVRIEKKQYFDRNISDISIELIYFILGILQVGAYLDRHMIIRHI